MIKHFYGSFLPRAIFLSFLLFFVSACSFQPTGSTGGSGTPSASGSPGSSATGTPVPQTVQMPPTQTACPAANTARAAVMRLLVLGQFQNLVYVYNEVPQNTTTSTGYLKRYDVSNGRKAEIISSGLSIDQAQVSADGQWVLFLSIPDPRSDTQHSAMLQLVRMDGEGLQTLYCFHHMTYSNLSGSSKLPISIKWSVDQKSILVSENTNNNTSQVFVLDVATGGLRQLFLDQNDTNYAYRAATWLDTTHFYLVKEGTSGPTPPATIYLVNASVATVTSPGLTSIYTTPTRMSYYSFDSSYDGTLLYSSYCLLAASPFSTTIQVGPATGGTRHTIFQEQPSDCIQAMRAVSSSTLLLLTQVASSGAGNFSDQLWTMNLPGDSTKSLTTLTNPNSGQNGFNFNQTSQFPWSNVSRDGGDYALQAIDPVATNQTVLVGSMKGGNPTAVAVTNPGNSSVSLAGCTTL